MLGVCADGVGGNLHGGNFGVLVKGVLGAFWYDFLTIVEANKYSDSMSFSDYCIVQVILQNLPKNELLVAVIKQNWSKQKQALTARSNSG